MSSLKVVNMAGKEVGTIELSDKVFGAEVNGPLLHSAVKMYLANQRQGTQSTLTRSEVSGGGKKPWRQKGTGRARQGSTRSPQWTHGGIALGPKPRSYRISMNKKAHRAAMFSAFSSKVASGEMIVVDKIACEEYKTKVMVKMLQDIQAKGKTLVVLASNDDKVVRSLCNIEGVRAQQYNALSVYDILNCESIVFAQEAVAKIEEVYAE